MAYRLWLTRCVWVTGECCDMSAMWHQRTWPKNPWSDSAHVMQLLRLLNCIIFLRSCIMGFYLVFESRCALAISCACLLLTLALWNNISCSSDDALKSTMLLFDSEIICVITTPHVTRSRAFVLCRSGAYQNGRRNAKWEKAYSFFQNIGLFAKT